MASLFTTVCTAGDYFDDTTVGLILTASTHQAFLDAADDVSSGSTDINLQLSGTLGTYTTGQLQNRLTVLESDIRRISTMKGLKQNLPNVKRDIINEIKETAEIIRGSNRCSLRRGDNSVDQRHYKNTIRPKFQRL